MMEIGWDLSLIICRVWEAEETGIGEWSLMSGCD